MHDFQGVSITRTEQLPIIDVDVGSAMTEIHETVEVHAATNPERDIRMPFYRIEVGKTIFGRRFATLVEGQEFHVKMDREIFLY